MSYGLLSLLGIGAVFDVRTRKIPVYVIVWFGAAGLFLRAIHGQLLNAEWVLGAAVGVLLLAVSRISRESLGVADALILIVSGIYLGFAGNLVLLTVALVQSLLAGVCVAVMKREKLWKMKLPFVPFLLGAYCMMFVIW